MAGSALLRDFTASAAACLADGEQQTWLFEPDTPAGGFWYLVRATNPAGAGTYDSGEPRQVGTREAEFAAPAGACP